MASSSRAKGGWVEKGTIGEGGFGVVKLFVNESLNQQVVVKECRRPSMNQDFVARWCQELELIKRLRHPNVIQATDAPTGLNYQAMGDIPFICMEYCEEGDLRKVLRSPDNCCGLPEDQIREICNGINSGIRFLHLQKVIHRDLKPENILIKRGDKGKLVYKLTDFGYSKSYDINSVCTSMVGTMQYVAPEVMQSKSYHSSVDFWSFGVVVFECITGKRPFLHGCPSNSIAWVEYVSKKSSEDIYIYFSQDGSNKVLSSSRLPRPHRLSKNLEARLTSWLQTALHFDPEKRGNRRRQGEDAVCLSNMDHILSTKMISTINMSTAEEFSFNIDPTTTYQRLNELISEQSPILISPDRQLLVTASGRVPRKEELVLQSLEDSSSGRLFVFTADVEPSFRVMHSANQAVSDLTAYGDGKFPYNVLRELYSKVFFHIRENLSFFRNLYDGHAAILELISEKCEEIKQQQLGLQSCSDTTREILDLVVTMHDKDLVRLEESIQNGKVSQSCECLENWRTRQEDMRREGNKLDNVVREMEKIGTDAASYLVIVKDLKSVHFTMDKKLEEYQLSHVKMARNLYVEIKSSRSKMVSQPNPSMQEVLLRAQHEAQTIIELCLNGHNYGQVFLTLFSHLHRIQDCLHLLGEIKEQVKQLNDARQYDIWNNIVASKRDSPSSSLGVAFNQSRSREGSDAGLVMAPPAGGSQRQISAEELRRQFSTNSTSSVDSVCDIAVTQSLIDLQRRLSEEDNSFLISKNKDLRSRYSSLVRSGSVTESVKSGYLRNNSNSSS